MESSLTVAKRVKPGVIELTFGAPAGEIESFTLLKLSDPEAMALMSLADNVRKDSAGGVATVRYGGDSPVYGLWKKFGVEHKKANADFLDVSFKYQPALPGTSAIVRDPIKHAIKIVRRKKQDEVNHINKLSISDHARELFFKDCKRSALCREGGGYAMDSRDKVYAFWSKYMNQAYVANVYGNGVAGEGRKKKVR